MYGSQPRQSASDVNPGREQASFVAKSLNCGSLGGAANLFCHTNQIDINVPPTMRTGLLSQVDAALYKTERVAQVFGKDSLNLSRQHKAD